MTVEEKARAYDEALETARKINSGEGVAAPGDWTVYEVIFPELRESEDEKIRKELIDAINGLWANDALPMPFSLRRKNNWIAWLEKQGKKPPVLSNSLNIGKDLQIDGFDAELNALLKKYEHLPYDETIECLKYYVGVLVNMRNKAMEEQE